MEREWVLGGKKDCCKHCNSKMKARETQDSILLICINQKCSNYWVNQGCEIIMMLK